MKNMNAIFEFIDKNKYYNTRKELYIIGNASLYFQGLIKDEPKDYDILIYDGDSWDVNMPSGRIDGVLFLLALLPKDYTTRAVYYGEYKDVSIYFVGIEDIVINKISGYHFEKHRKAILSNIQMTNKKKIFNLLEEVKKQDFIPVRDKVFRNNISSFEHDFSVTAVTRTFRKIIDVFKFEPKNSYEETD